MQVFRHFLGFVLIAAAVAFGSPASAAENIPFDQQKFETAQQAGKPILVEVFAPWCPTCRAQAKVLAPLSAEPRFSEFVRFKIDFDGQKDLLRLFNVRVQSTLIVFKGRNETGRLIGETDPAAITALLESAI